jgi:hypothetical protein
MFIRMAGATLGLLMLSATLAAPAHATQYDFGGTVKDIGSLSTPGTLDFSNVGASGNNNPDEVDYIFRFSLNGPAKLTANVAANGTDFNELHAVLYSSDPASKPLFSNGDPGIVGGAGNPNLIDVGDLSDILTANSSSGNSAALTLASLASGSYFLRVFGDPVELESFFTGTIAATPVGAVPIPGALPLLLTALGGLGFAAHRRKAATA